MEKVHHLISRYFERLRHKHHPAATELNVIHLFFYLTGRSQKLSKLLQRQFKAVHLWTVRSSTALIIQKPGSIQGQSIAQRAEAGTDVCMLTSRVVPTACTTPTVNE